MERHLEVQFKDRTEPHRRRSGKHQASRLPSSLFDDTTDTMRFTTSYNLTQELVQADGYHDIFTTGTYVNNNQVLRKAIDIHNENIEKAKAEAKSESWSIDTIVQPWPKLFWNILSPRAAMYSA
ncbi:uncharacterized protein BP01DRAFT_388626 [Aspergillus saccharolyticus JOP 1030-1]|uniref:Uncharacterized protein n=1 Tax=Aspergillus saccharolyticus JOP 1030-1 TaxID=1450539 RepID=A0A318ZWT2_9EURO|nr:hypothetical protein BP01DRAFT_388626 [Aspergillus saccharolyticus JOP 1030-1]PYH48773.1 hypothetical protein BP01DRAFT_388626 [Aspergillus saccharolyticus JOP 1030-1]